MDLLGVPNEPKPAQSRASATLTPESDRLVDFNNDQDEASRLEALGANVRQQDDLEDAVGKQADQMFMQQADERDNKRLEKTYKQKQKVEEQLRPLKQKLRANPSSLRNQSEINQLQSELDQLDRDLEQIQQRIEERHNDADGEPSQDLATGNKRPGESQREYLIRTGKITPFSKIGQTQIKHSNNLADVMLDAEDGFENGEDLDDEYNEPIDASAGPVSHVNLARPGFEDDISSNAESAAEMVKTSARKKRKLALPKDKGTPVLHSSEHSRESSETAPTSADAEDSDDEFGVVKEQYDGTSTGGTSSKKRARGVDNALEDLTNVDDGNERLYQARLEKWVTRRKQARERNAAKHSASAVVTDMGDNLVPSTNDEGIAEQDNESLGSTQQEWHLPHPTREDTVFSGGFRMPGDVYPSLFDYQKTGVQWLWELYQQRVGGIVGDEMGLGKTIQIISFLAGLHHSNKYPGPIIVVCPATVMKQWVNEFHAWWPAFRVSILHTSGSGMLDVRSEAKFDDDLELGRSSGSQRRGSKTYKAAKKIVERVVKDGHVLVTTYSGLQSYADLLIPVAWGYAVLDEGHKIRNPNTSVTIFCKELRTHHRIIASGTPIQNNLTELWSLFDFVFPMRLGNLITFRTQFEIPIRQGGYANASNLQVETALNCAQALKEAISPYLLQRWKSDVAADLPAKTEQVLFCKLTRTQLDMYRRFITSAEKEAIIEGKRKALYGIDILRKICNHPDLVDHHVMSKKPGYPYGDPTKSGKMQVVKALLQLWQETGHKTLLFAQHRIMLDILEKFVKHLPNINYCRMDGTTPITQRQNMMDRFNKDPSIHLFLLTTKVGGLGVNLTSADRVIIYDPDWNPSTDVQARERAWRLGQKREVMIYRLMMAGTIEEKIYHRQLFKQFLTNKILKDPKQRQTFHLQGLEDLFSLNDPRMQNEETETGQLFQGNENRVAPPTVYHGGSTLNNSRDASHGHENDRISAIRGLSHRESAAKSSNPEANGTNPDGMLAKSEGHNDGQATKQAPQNHLLTSLLSQSGVATTFDHDAILSSSDPKHKGRYDANGKLLADPRQITREAKRVAAEAAKQLKRAGEEARHVPIGTVTWTGQFGEAGMPNLEAPVPGLGRGGVFSARGGTNSRGGPSSTSVLANLAQKQSHQRNADEVAKGASDRTDQQPKGKDFLELIRNYLKTHNGRVYTRMLIDQFNRFCTTEQRTAEFKEMLREIATLDKNGQGVRRGGRAMWVLKDEYK